MITLKRLGHVALHVGDLDRSKSFYVQLGCHVLEEETAEHGRVCFLAIGDHGNTLDLIESPQKADIAPPAVGRGLHHLAFETATRDALKSAYFSLLDAGIEVPFLVDHQTSQSIYLRDPDGNIVEIYWTPPEAAALWASGRTDEHRALVFER